MDKKQKLLFTVPLLTELLSPISAILAIIFSLLHNWNGFYICGFVLFVITVYGVIGGGIKYPFRIYGFVLLAVVLSLIFKWNIINNILFALCVESIYTYILWFPYQWVKYCVKKLFKKE